MGRLEKTSTDWAAWRKTPRIELSLASLHTYYMCRIRRHTLHVYRMRLFDLTLQLRTFRVPPPAFLSLQQFPFLSVSIVASSWWGHRSTVPLWKSASDRPSFPHSLGRASKGNLLCWITAYSGIDIQWLKRVYVDSCDNPPSNCPSRTKTDRKRNKPTSSLGKTNSKEKTPDTLART